MSSKTNRIISVVIILVLFAGLFYEAYRHKGLTTDTRTAVVTTRDEDEPVDYETLSEKELLVMAYDGDAQAAYHLGLVYDFGLMGTAQSFERAKQWYEIADASRLAPAACALGYLYLNGCGVDQNYKIAREYFGRSIAEGYDEGHVGMGRIALAKLEEQGGVDKEGKLEKEAFHQMKLACDWNEPDGIYFMGYLSEMGIGTRQDYDQAVAFYNETLDIAGDSITDKYAVDNAHTRLGLMYIDGKGVEKDMAKGRALLEEAANNGYSMAQYYMGVIYDKGYGTNVDYEEALRWFELAAQEDYAPALNQIGCMYFLGNGVNPDYSQAVYYQKLSAALGYPKAQVNLGYLYENGYGVEKDYEAALSYYKMASKANYKGANEAVLRVESILRKQNNS